MASPAKLVSTVYDAFPNAGYRKQLRMTPKIMWFSSFGSQIGMRLRKHCASHMPHCNEVQSQPKQRDVHGIWDGYQSQSASIDLHNANGPFV